MLKQFQRFMSDSSAEEMFITGRAGTGKTTRLRELVEWLIAEQVPYVVCAYTHKACNILASKLPADAKIETLHKFLKKRPGVNTDAKHLKHVDITTQMAAPEAPQVLLIDEFSMVGEKDLISIRELVDVDDDDNVSLKVCWIGEEIQLPPVGDAEAVFPGGDYNFKLTKRYRQDEDNELVPTIDSLAAFIEGRKKPEYLPPNKNFYRDMDILERYKLDESKDKVILAYTNKAVQAINFSIEGKEQPEQHDTVFSPSTKQRYTFIEPCKYVPYLDRAFGDQLQYGSKYRTLENLPLLDVDFCRVADEEGEDYYFAYVFGHYNYQQRLKELKQAAVEANSEIEQKYNMKASVWAKANHDNPVARRRAQAWAQFISFNNNVICLDFAHSTTVHKSQGSTYYNVYVDDKDLAICASRDMNMYLRLRYVAYSRASNKVESNA